MSSGLVKNLKRFLSRVLTFSYPKYRFFTILLVLFLLFIVPISFLQSTLPNLSICHYLFGKYCYSVGITRGVSSLLKGNLTEALDYNWLAIPALIVLIGILIYDLVKFSKPK